MCLELCQVLDQNGAQKLFRVRGLKVDVKEISLGVRIKEQSPVKAAPK
jgi:hypothetical protein